MPINITMATALNFYSSEVRQRVRSEAGFTLIELLTVCAILGVLVGLSITSMKVYRTDASYGVAETTLANAKIALEAGILANEASPASVAMYAQSNSGMIADPTAQALLPAMQIPKNLKFQVDYDNTCVEGDPACRSALLQVDHCFSEEYIRWLRFADGSEVKLEHVAGANCH